MIFVATGTAAEVTLSKLAKFEKLKGVKYPSDADLTRSYGTINSDNDRSDARLCIVWSSMQPIF